MKLDADDRKENPKSEKKVLYMMKPPRYCESVEDLAIFQKSESVCSKEIKILARVFKTTSFLFRRHTFLILYETQIYKHAHNGGLVNFTRIRLFLSPKRHNEKGI